MNKRKISLTLLKASLIFVMFYSTVASAWEIQWFGQAACKITTEKGKVILIDPFISKNPVTPKELKDLKKLGKIDLILVTHGHGDHVGDTAELAKSSGAKVAMNADMGHTFGMLGLVPYDQLIRFNKSGPIKPVEGITVTMVRAEHSSDVMHTDSETGKKSLHSGGEPAGYIIEMENGDRLYHAGDTGVFLDMKFIGDYYQPKLALVPIGGHFTMDPEHAAYAVKDLLKPDEVVPIHYGTFPVLKGTPEEFKKALGDYSGKLTVLKPGDILKY